MRFYFLFIIHLIYSQTELNYGQLFQFQSQSLGERTYRISLPESYSQSSVSYPVVYLLDANFYFLDAVSTIRFLSASGTIPELIVIGIDSKNRRQEMTPPGFSLPDVSNGSADKFLSFLSGELIPEIEKKYRCNPLRILAGHSHAALFANYAFTTSKHAFRWYLLLDPPAHLESYKIETVSLDYLRSQKEPGRLFVYENTFGWSDENWNAALKITSSVKLHREKIT
ncbi:MAG: hypothetical protein KDD94_13180, partial [Calditrichaeota bacterium]|nr:hypothetical protein [Calditrichota bacterium]